MKHPPPYVSSQIGFNHTVTIMMPIVSDCTNMPLLEGKALQIKSYAILPLTAESINTSGRGYESCDGMSSWKSNFWIILKIYPFLLVAKQEYQFQAIMDCVMKTEQLLCSVVILS
jgi:hypothetical protein